jgi:hypothetical protein
MKRKGVTPMPPARNTAGRVASSCSTISPLGPSIRTGVPRAADLSKPWAALEGPDTRKPVRHFVARPGVVVPVELAGLFAPGEFVRTITKRLVLRKAALTQPDFFSFDDVAGRLLRGTLYEAGHIESLD